MNESNLLIRLRDDDGTGFYGLTALPLPILPQSGEGEKVIVGANAVGLLAAIDRLLLVKS